MRDDITSIPISEVFEPKDGCPVCRLRDILEERSVTYITGAAMMEPDVRIETNKVGFCHHHYSQMLKNSKNLTIALILQSHLAQLAKDGTYKTPAKNKKGVKSDRSCFICNKMNRNMDNIVDNICILWEKEKEFKVLYSEQPYICLNHCRDLISSADKISKKDRKEFIKITQQLCENKLVELAGDLKHFCNMFDYRNNGEEDWGNSKDSVERTIEYLTTRQANK
jgi:hypothetical protein